MTVEQTLFTTLSTDANVSALISNSSSPETYRIFPEVAPDEVTKPFIVYSLISAIKPQTFSGRSVLENTRMQIDCYSTSYAQSRALSALVLTAVDENMAVGTNQAISFYEQETQLYRISLDISLWE